MKKLNWSTIHSYWNKNKGNIALSVGFGGFASLAAMFAFEATFINEVAYNHILSLLAPGVLSDIFSVGNAKWIVLISVVALLLLPMLYNSKNQIFVFVLTFFILMDGLLALIMFVNQEINNGELIFISISFMYYVFVLILFLKFIYRWLHDADKKVDVVKLTFLWTVIVAVFGLLR